MAKRAHPPKRILSVDIGGSKVKFLATGETEPRRIPSGNGLSPAKMVERIKSLTRDWDYGAVSIGYCGLVGGSGPLAEPENLGSGWVGFDFAAAFDCPVRIVNDAAMQALGSYQGGRMLFLGLGTGLGSAFVADGQLEPLELAHLPYRNNRSYEDYVGLRGYKRLGRKKWRRHVLKIVELLKHGLQADYVMLGGGNSKKLKRLPRGARLGDNANSILGGIRLWDKAPTPRHWPLSTPRRKTVKGKTQP